MSKQRWWMGIPGLLLLVVLLGALVPAGQAVSISFADPAFNNLWQRSDRPVDEHRVDRSWIWGPARTGAQAEPYREAPHYGNTPGGQRLVQYFEKARMEINNRLPASDPYFVTTGLLVVELITGHRNIGDNDYDLAIPSNVPIAGDTTDQQNDRVPTYAELNLVANSAGSVGANATPAPVGMAFRQSLDRRGVGTIGVAPPEAPQDARSTAVKYIPETHHNIPAVFWDFLNQQGQVYQNGQYPVAPVVDWVSAMGYPITEPYWTQIRVGGQYQWIMFQAFQRRILTFNPANPSAFRVEMGNVGLHYYDWRYNPAKVPDQALVMGVQGSAELCFQAQDLNCTSGWAPARAYTNGVSDTGQARTGNNSIVDIETRSAAFRLESNATLQFKQITNAAEDLLHKAGRMFVAHDPAGRDKITVDAGHVRVDATDSRFSIVVTDTAAPGEPTEYVAVPADGGDVHVSSLGGGPAGFSVFSLGPRAQAASQVVVRAGQQIVIRNPAAGLPAPEPIDPAEQQRWNVVLDQWHNQGVRTPDLGAVPGPKLVSAFYYPWYGPTTWDRTRMSDFPLQTYVSADRATMDRQIREAQGAGIDAFISSWTGQDTEADQNLGPLLAVAAQHQFQISTYLEIDSIVKQGALEPQLGRMLATYPPAPAFLHWDGKPVLFFWKPEAYGDVNAWRDLRSRLDPNHNQIWSVDTVDAQWLDVFDSIHLFTAGKWDAGTDVGRVDQDWRDTIDRYNREHDTRRLWTAGVAPGWDESRIQPPRIPARIVPRQNGAVYQETWCAAIASAPEWITITSYNEWFEGSQIEPSVSYGTQYLDLTRQWIQAYKQGTACQPAPPPPLPTPPPAPLPTPGPGGLQFFTSGTPGCDATPQTTFTYPQVVYAQVGLDSALAGTEVEITWSGGVNNFSRTDLQVSDTPHQPACFDGFSLDPAQFGIGRGTYTLTLRINGVTYDPIQITIQ